MARANISAQFEAATKVALLAVQQQHAAIAKAANAAVMGAEAGPSNFLRIVDGREGASEETVKFGGRIVYRYPPDQVVEFALHTLQELSPVYEGNYLESHQLFLDRRAVDDLRAWRPGREITIANFVPYARVIEIGGMRMRVPGTDHVYQQAERIVRSRYGAAVDVKFTFVNLYDGVVIRVQRRSAETRFPALIFTER